VLFGYTIGEHLEVRKRCILAGTLCGALGYGYNMLMRRSPISQLWPSGVEIGYILLITCAILLVGNGKLLLERAGLIGSAHLIGEQVSTKVVWGTGLLDTFRFTAGAINLIVWGGTGLIIYSVLQSFVQVLRTIQYDRDFDSNRYIHPRNFTHHAYWVQVATNAITGFVLMAMFAVGAFAYIAIAVPDSFAYIHRFIFHPSLQNTVDLLIGTGVAFVATGILFVLAMLVIRHHQLSKFQE